MNSLHHIFFSRQTDDGDTKKVERVKPDAEIERNELVPENILRWEDDGGPAFEPENLIHQPVENMTPQSMEAAE